MVIVNERLPFPVLNLGLTAAAVVKTLFGRLQAPPKAC